MKISAYPDDADSDGKRLARVTMYGRALRQSPSNGLVLYLTSKKGLDAAVLKTFGVRAARQLAVSHDVGEVAGFQKCHPDVEAVCADVGVVVRAYGKCFSLINLDFCTTVDGGLVEKIAECLPYVVDGGTLAYTALRGREKNWNLSARPDRLEDPRADINRREVQRLTNLGIDPHTYLAYHSVREGSVGVPMMVDAWTVTRGKVIAMKATAKQTVGFQFRDMNKFFGDKRAWFDLHGADGAAIVEASYALEGMGLDPASALGLTRSALAAYRAHNTRGTYASFRGKVVTTKMKK